MRSMTARMTVGYALAVTIAVGASLVAGRWLLSREMIGGLELLHEAEFKELLSGMDGDPTRLPRDEFVQRMQGHAEEDADLYLFQVHNENGEVLFRSPTLGNALLPDLSASGRNWTVDVPPFGPVYTSEYVYGSLHFQIASRLAPARTVLRRYTQASAVIAGIVALGSLALGFTISRFALRPLRSIERTARRISADNLSERIPAPAGRDEVSELVRLLNAMFDRLEESFRQIRQFAADASHELKTPLTLIRLNAEQIRRRLDGDAALGSSIDDLLEEITRMNQVIERLLFLARAGSGTYPLQGGSHDIARFVAGVADDVAVLTEDRGLRFVLGRNDAGRGIFDAGLMRQLLLNLASNAVKASPPGGTVTLLSEIAGDRWRIEVVDEGTGVEAARLDHLFERFGGSAGEATEGFHNGHGLGLAICRGIARLHKGDIRAENRTDRGGLRMVVEIPQGVVEGIECRDQGPETRD